MGSTSTICLVLAVLLAIHSGIVFAALKPRDHLLSKTFYQAPNASEPVAPPRCNVVDKRPPPGQRLFRSPAVENFIEDICAEITDPELAALFVNCFPNTLDTTVQNYTASETDPDTFVITGDIPAMWLRDSAAQMWPYLELMDEDPRLQNLVKGVVLRHARSILIDPYANAFVYNTSKSPWVSDQRIPPMSNKLWEGKYELDSLAWPVALAAQYWSLTKDNDLCQDETWLSSMSKVLDVVEYQQQSSASMSASDPEFYFFGRLTRDSIDTLFGGIGQPSRQNGMARSAFRPSDDSHVLPYHVPSNAFMSVALNALSDVLTTPGCLSIPGGPIAKRASDLSNDLAVGVRQYGVVNIQNVGDVFAYEVNGYGSFYAMDDANLPSLLSLPYFGFVEEVDDIYELTRKFVLSDNNMYFFQNATTGLRGIGSPHTGQDNIWPMAVIMQALTSNDDNEIQGCLQILKTSAAGTGFMHESFSASDPTNYTRSWFAFVNGLFGSLIVKIVNERPHLLK